MAFFERIIPWYLYDDSAQNNLAGGIKHLAAFSHLSNLGLTDCKLDDDDIKDLAGLSWENLESVWISYNKFHSKGVEYLISGKWPKLTSLHLSTFISIQVETHSEMRV